MNKTPNWPLDYQYGYYAIPDYWAGVVKLPLISLSDLYEKIEWLEQTIPNFSNNIWWHNSHNQLLIAFRKESERNWFILRWNV